MTAPRQRLVKLTPKQEKDAYRIATERDGGLEVEGGICQRCLRDCGPVERDHRQNRDPYNTVASNLQCLGRKCHTWKTQNPEQALAEGWSVPKFTELTPEEFPARRYRRTPFGTLHPIWVLYDNVGGWTEIDEVEARFRRRKGGVV